MLLMTPILKEAVKLVRCRNLYREDSPINFLMVDYETECGTESHRSELAKWFWPTMTIGGVLIPGLVMFFLLTNRRKL